MVNKKNIQKDTNITITKLMLLTMLIIFFLNVNKSLYRRSYFHIKFGSDKYILQIKLPWFVFSKNNL